MLERSLPDESKIELFRNVPIDITAEYRQAGRFN